jgi:hypothetical protein
VALRHWVRTFSLWLSLAVVLTCAIGSFGSPVSASTGSAFNAFTSDVTLGPSRASEPEKASKEQTPASGGTGQAGAILRASTALPAPPKPAAPVPSRLVPAPTPVVTTGPLGARAPPFS